MMLVSGQRSSVLMVGAGVLTDSTLVVMSRRLPLASEPPVFVQDGRTDRHAFLGGPGAALQQAVFAQVLADAEHRGLADAGAFIAEEFLDCRNLSGGDRRTTGAHQDAEQLSRNGRSSL